MATKVFLVHCAENSGLAAEIAAELARLGAEVLTDDRSQAARAAIAPAMSRSHAPVLLLVTDNFLRSSECMDGLPELLKNHENQLVAAVANGSLPDPANPSEMIEVQTAFESINEVMQYRDHWYEKWVALRKKLPTLPPSEQPIVEAEIAVAQTVSTAMGSYLRHLRQLGPVSLSALRAENFARLLALAPAEGELPAEFSESVPARIFEASVPAAGPSAEVPPAEEKENGYERIVSKGFDESLPPAPTETEPAAEPAAAESTEDSDAPPSSPLTDTYMESVNREMEKAARILRELSGDAEEDEDTLPAPAGPPPVQAPVPLPSKEAEKTANGAENAPNQTYAELLARFPEDPRQALEALRTIVATDDKNEEAIRHLADLSASLGLFRDALALYENLIGLHPGDGDAYFKAAVLLDEKLGEKEKASEYFRDALYLEDLNPRYHFRYGRFLLDAFQKEKKASKHFKRALELDSRFAEAHLELARLYAGELGKPDKAIKHYALARAIDPALRDEALDGWLQSGTSGEKAAARQQAIRLPGQTDPSAAVLVFVTGATSGIGRATARVLAERGCRLILAARRTDRLEALAQELKTEHGSDILTLHLDVRNQRAVDEAVAALPEAWREVDVLVNNAGLAKGLSPIDQGEIEHWDTMIDTNVKGLLYVTRAVAPGMVARKRGHIVNISSTAAKEVYPKGNVYCATKFAVDALNRGMRMDLCPHHIRVTAISPGHTEHTEFALVRFDQDAEKARIYEDFVPLQAEDVAEAVWFALSRPPHVNINEIVLSGTQQASATVIHRSGRGVF